MTIAEYLQDYDQSYICGLIKNSLPYPESECVYVNNTAMEHYDLSEIIEYVRKTVNPGRYLIIAANSEAFCFRGCAILSEVLSQSVVSPEQIAFVSSAMPIPENTKVFHELFPQEVNLYYLSNWQMAVNDNNKRIRKAPVNPHHCDYILNCFNVHAKPHRYGIVSEIIRNGMLDQSLISLQMNPEHAIHQGNVNLDVFPDLYPDWLQVWRDHQHLLPMLLNFSRDSFFYVDTETLQILANSYLSVITETMYLNLENSQNLDVSQISPSYYAQFMTEKTTRTMLARHPFVIVSTPGFLKSMRMMGYQTFHPHIDESYDQIEDDQERMKAISALLKKFKDYTPADWHEFQESVKPILKHNVQHLRKHQRFCLHHTEVDNYLAQFQ